jgi:hypothetical protein
MKHLILFALTLSVPMMAQEQKPNTNLYKLSVEALAVSTTFDLATSIADSLGCGKVACHETNSLLSSGNGEFSTARAIALKSALNGGLVLGELLLVKKYPQLKKAFTVINFGDAGLYTYTGFHNLSIRR